MYNITEYGMEIDFPVPDIQTDEDIKNMKTYDVIVIGAGNGGVREGGSFDSAFGTP